MDGSTELTAISDAGRVAGASADGVPGMRADDVGGLFESPDLGHHDRAGAPAPVDPSVPAQGLLPLPPALPPRGGGRAGAAAPRVRAGRDRDGRSAAVRGAQERSRNPPLP